MDCYDETEQSMGWYYYMEENLEFPFTAKAKIKKKDGSYDTKTVNVTGLDSDEEGFTGDDFMLEMEAGDYVVPIAYSNLSHIKGSAQTKEALAIWAYWLKGR